MSGENNIVGLWRDREGQQAGSTDVEQSAVDAYVTEPTEKDNFAAFDDGEESYVGGRWRRPLALGAFLGGAASWVGLCAYTQYVALGGRTPGLPDAVSFLSTVSAPLALLGVGWVLLLRNSTREESRYARTVQDLRSESQRLDASLSFVSERISQSKQALSEQNDSLLSFGDEAAQRLTSVGQAMRTEVETIGRYTVALKNSAAAARADMAVLLSDLPKAHGQTRQLIGTLQEAGVNAHSQAGALEGQIASLAAKSREAQDLAGGAAERLAAHLSRMDSVSETAGERLQDAASQMTNAVDGALERAAEALSTARQGMEAQGAAMRAMVEQSQAALQSAGADASDALSQRVESISARVEQMAKLFAEQDQLSQTLSQRISEQLEGFESRFAEIASTGNERSTALSGSLAKLKDQSESLNATLDAGGMTAATLIERAEALLTALDASAKELDESLPNAYDRIAAKAEESETRSKAALAEMVAIEKSASASLQQLTEAEKLLSRQREAVDSLVSGTGSSLDESRKAVDELTQSISAAEEKAASLAIGAGPQLIEALIRVKETANQAAEHSREAFADIIPQTAAALSAKSREALEAAITKQVEDKLVEVAQTAENAVVAAQKATDRLMRQMLTIAETSTALESRIAEAKQEVEEADQSNFSRRIALLIESLNSTAIDVTKILSNDVTDTAWASYLKGDRGVFTRRAVRLLDASELKEILRHYDNEPEFRDHVNRYIHDFEAMLRHVLSTREGSALSVTLLSSDAGKLYVALAQAIERLRT